MISSKLNFIGLLLLGCIAVASCKYCNLKFTDCGSTEGKIYSVHINAKCENDKAILKKGTNVKIIFTFSANAPQSYLTSKVFGQFPLIPTWIPFPLANSNGCKYSGLSCPIRANRKYQFRPVLPIKSSYPAIPVIFKWKLLDRRGRNIFCAQMDTDIMP